MSVFIDPENDIVSYWQDRMTKFKHDQLPKWVNKTKKRWEAYGCQRCTITTHRDVLKYVATMTRLGQLSIGVAGYLIGLLNTDTPPMAVLLQACGRAST